jgi:hypothetical protein
MCEITDRLLRKRHKKSAGEGQARRVPLSCNRTLVLDFLPHAQKVPHFPVERMFDLAEVAELRARAGVKIAWSLLFLKAYALVARDHAALRRTYQRWPWPHLVQSPRSVASLVVSRQFQGEDRICWARFREPEARPLAELQSRLQRFQTAPVEEVFKQQVLVSRLPGPLRRLLLWWNIHLAGAKRSERLGTFTLSTLAGQGVTNRGHQSVLTTSLTYGPLDAEGRSLVTLLCDHRVLDGMTAAAAINDLHRVLTGEIARELKSLGVAKAA